MSESKIKQLELQKRMKRVRGMIPISVIDAHIPRLTRKLFIESYWNVADNRAALWMKQRIPLTFEPVDTKN